MDEFNRIERSDRARMIAHVMHKAQRENFIEAWRVERLEKKNGGTGSGGSGGYNPMEAMHRKMGIGPKRQWMV